MRELLVVELGTVPYGEALELQRGVARGRIRGDIAEDVLLLVEHPPVVTLGRTASAAHLVASSASLAARGVEVFEVERGGDITFHGPGQLVGYPIIDLKQHRQDLHWYLRQVEEALIVALGALGVAAERNPGLTGVWTRGRKIASIGVHARDWVTWHGFALNVNTDLSWFDLIVPCGIPDVTMTSVARETGAARADEPRVRAETARAFATVFSLAPRAARHEDLALDAPVGADSAPAGSTETRAAHAAGGG
jgi:lipoate-protein ligase B